MAGLLTRVIRIIITIAISIIIIMAISAISIHTKSIDPPSRGLQSLGFRVPKP